MKNSSSTKEPFLLNLIFEKDSKDIYTKNALLYQNILEYIFDEDKPNAPFRFNDLAKWLMKKNIEFFNYYSGSLSRTSMSNRIANKRDRIQRCIDNLEYSGLISKQGTTKAKKNNETIPLYGYSLHGTIVALLILYNINTDKRKYAGDKIFDLIHRYFSLYDSHIVDFTSKLYAKAREKGFSNTIIGFLFKILDTDNVKIRNMVDALNLVLYLHLEKEPLGHTFVNIWMETLNEFEENTRNIIICHDKSEIESRISLSQPPKDWEEIWIKMYRIIQNLFYMVNVEIVQKDIL